MQLKDDKSEAKPLEQGAEEGTGAVVEPDEDLETRLRRAHDLSQDGFIEKANAIYEESLSTLDPADSDAHDSIVECLWNVANNLYGHNQIEECVPVFKRLIESQEARHGAEDGVLITPLLRLAIALKRVGEVEESEAVFERSMKLAKLANPEGHLHTADKSIKKKVVPAAPVESKKSETDLNDTSFAPGDDASAEPSGAAGGKSADGGIGEDGSGDAASGPAAAVVNEFDDATKEPDIFMGTSNAPAPAKPANPEADVLKYLFSDNAPDLAAPPATPRIEIDVPRRGGAANMRSRGVQPREQHGFVDRNPAMTQLSELDLAAIGAIPSPDAMSKMFRDAPSSDVGARTKAAAFLKTTEGTDEDVNFSVAAKNFDSKKSAPFLVRNKWLLPTLVIGVIALGAFLVGKSMLDKNGALENMKGATGSATEEPMHTWASFDKSTVLKLFKGDWATYTSDGKSHRAKCYFLAGDPRDFLTVVPGAFSGKDIWLGETPEGLKQADGAALYSPDAASGAVVKEMTLIAQRAQDYYRINHSYPTTPEQFQNISTNYINPFTHRGDPPQLYTTYSTTMGSSALKLEAKTSVGENWINEMSIGPGSIHCCSLIYEDAAGKPTANNVNTAIAGSSGTGTDFFIRAGDKDGHFIPGTKAGEVFYIMLNQGKSTSLDTIQNGPDKPMELSKTRILVAKDLSEQSVFMFLMGAIPAVLLMGIGFGWLIQHRLYEQKDALSVARKSTMTRLLVVCSVLLAAWLAICALG